MTRDAQAWRRRGAWIAAVAAIALGSAALALDVRVARAWNGITAPAPQLLVEREGEPPTPPLTPQGPPIALYVGYYDTHHPANTRGKPVPWKGSVGVVFVGKSDSDGGWDSACIRLDNLVDGDLTNVSVTVDIGVEHFALWGTHSIPGHGTMILAQTAFENFDGSDTNVAGCYSCRASDCLTKVSNAIPLITVKTGSRTTQYLDRAQVLNTRGVDAAGCPYTGSRSDESQSWVEVDPRGSLQAGPAGVEQDATSLQPPTAVVLDAPAPNPSRGSVMFRFQTPAAGDVSLGMYDVAGRLVRTCVDGWYESGTYLRGLDLTGVQPGVYFGILRAPGGEVKRAFIVTR